MGMLCIRYSLVDGSHGMIHFDAACLYVSKSISVHTRGHICVFSLVLLTGPQVFKSAAAY